MILVQWVFLDFTQTSGLMASYYVCENGVDPLLYYKVNSLEINHKQYNILHWKSLGRSPRFKRKVSVSFFADM